jgi:ribosomal protein L31
LPESCVFINIFDIFDIESPKNGVFIDICDRCQNFFTQGKSRQEAYDALFEEFKDELDAGLLRRSRITDNLAKSYGRTSSGSAVSVDCHPILFRSVWPKTWKHISHHSCLEGG